ncbi:MAG: hypothetical protein HC830_04750 [Bacteroidetes bacterium]|nr:hypothetical protein [Bacteroidales bacterium]NJO68666.1 hypothetical protein [Bacteroidota bacterium]
MHIAHVITCINQEKLDNCRVSALDENISLKAMVISFPENLDLHLREIEDLTVLKG